MCRHSSPKFPLNSDIASSLLSEKCAFLSVDSSIFFSALDNIQNGCLRRWQTPQGKYNSTQRTEQWTGRTWACTDSATRRRLSLSKAELPHFASVDITPISVVDLKIKLDNLTHKILTPPTSWSCHFCVPHLVGGPPSHSSEPLKAPGLELMCLWRVLRCGRQVYASSGGLSGRCVLTF